MRNSQGYATITWDDGRVQEFDTFTCNHCQRIVHVKPKCDPADLGGYCKICERLICAPCQQSMMKGNGCVPWEKQMEKIEARDRFLKSAGLL